MPERRVWIAQMLCGPNRHCIAALVGEADDEQEAGRELGRPLWPQVEKLLADSVNPWCGLCGSTRTNWRIELGRTPFRTMAEAESALAENAADQTLTSILYGTHGPKPPGKPN
jgi:hypothetical protein